MNIRRCTSCNNYTMEEKHCDVPTVIARPPKFSPDDKYAVYRREVRKKELSEKGLY